MILFEPPSHSYDVALVLGGARGQGLVLSKHLVSMGAKVWLWDEDQAVIDQATDQLASAKVRADQVTPATASAGVDRVIRDWGYVSIFVHASEDPQWQTASESTIRQAVLPVMQQRGYGRIVCVDLEPTDRSTKAAVTRSLSSELLAGKIAISCLTLSPDPAKRATSTQRSAPTSRQLAAMVGWLTRAENSYLNGAVIVANQLFGNA